MRLTLAAISILMVCLSFSCRKAEDEPQPQQAQPQQQPSTGGNVHTAVVQEVIQATSYTYLNVKEAGRDFWIAISKRDMAAGETISFPDSLEMKNFTSKELQRTFETIYFVSEISRAPVPAAGSPAVARAHQGTATTERQAISIEPAEGGITLSELFANRASYANKTVLIKGQVTKVNKAIMGKNWVHLQDGTSDAGMFDLTVTTQDDVAVGDVVTFEGTIKLDEDFGSGYAYEVLMEEAQRRTE